MKRTPAMLAVLLICLMLFACGKPSVQEPTPPEDVQPPAAEPTPLNVQNATETVESILESLLLHRDGTLEFMFPEELPVPREGIDLYVTLNLTYSQGEGSYRVERLLSTQAGWQPGQVYSAEWLPPEGETLISVMLRVAYLDDLGDGKYQQCYANYVELTEPLPMEETALTKELLLETDGDKTAVVYTAGNRRLTRIEMVLPQGVALQEKAPEELVLGVQKDGTAIGSLALMSYGTTDGEALAAVDPAAEQLPMQIYAPIALSNHVDYSGGYRVVASTRSSCCAVSRMRYQNLADHSGSAADAPWLEKDCILCYDLESETVFVCITLNPDVLTADDLQAWAESITFAS